MTQTAPPPVQLTLETMLAKFRDKHPTLIEPFEKVRPELEEGTGAQALANLIACKVVVEAEPGFFVYSWMGQNSPFELRIPRPFNPHPQHSGEMQQQAQVREAETASQTAQEGSVSVADPEAATTPTEATPEEVTPAEAAPETVETTPSGLFTALAALIGDSTLLMTVARTSEEGKEPVLTVTVIPQSEDAFTPVCLEGTVSDLDTHFVSALTARAESKKSVAQQIEALKAADKALEEAKKQEAAAKTKQAEAKKKAADKKEEQAKVEQVKVEEQAETDKQQEALF